MIVLPDEKSLRSTFLKAIPYMMLAEMVQSLQDVIIQFFLARTVGVAGTAAYGIVYPLLALMIGLSSFLVVGVLTVFSRDMGAGEQDGAALHLSAGITWAFFIMGAFSALCILFRSELTALLGATGDESYLAVMSMDALTLGTLSGPGFCALSILLTVQFFAADNRRAILLAIQSILLEVAFTAAFSLLLCSVAGVLTGYTLSVYIALANVLLQVMLHKGKDGRREPWARLHPVPAFRHVSLIIRTGLPEMTAWGLYVAFAAIRNLYILRLSETDALAAVTLSEGINQIGELIVSAQFNIIVSMLGAAWAAGDRKWYDKTVRVVWKTSLSIGLSYSVLQAALAYPMIRLFMEESNAGSVVHMSLVILLFYSLGYVFYTANLVFTGTYESIGRLSYAHLDYLLEYFALYLGFMLLLGTVFGITGVWAAFPATEAATCLVNFCLAWKNCGHFPRRLEDLGFGRRYVVKE
jgi:Na+-driven multidrug efflux pump